LSKSELRQQALKSRRSLTKDEVASRSGLVTRRLLQLPEFASAVSIATYVAKSDEVQTAAVISRALAEGKKVLVPRSDPQSSTLFFAEIHSLSELSPGHFGILEPAVSSPPLRLDSADIALVPIVAWDERGHRIGYGKGYFDRALEANRGPVTIGLAFESQRFGEVPQSAADVPLDIIVTEERVLRLRGGRR